MGVLLVSMRRNHVAFSIFVPSGRVRVLIEQWCWRFSRAGLSSFCLACSRLLTNICISTDFLGRFLNSNTKTMIALRFDELGSNLSARCLSSWMQYSNMVSVKSSPLDLTSARRLVTMLSSKTCDKLSLDCEERTMNYGSTEEDVEDMMLYGIRPYEEGAYVSAVS